jgi:hypothetical protein
MESGAFAAQLIIRLGKTESTEGTAQSARETAV